jgi:hypothetical protein
MTRFKRLSLGARSVRTGLCTLFTVSIVVAGMQSARADKKRSLGSPPNQIAAKSLSEKGTVLVRRGAEDWRAVETDAPLGAGALVVGLPGAEVSSNNSALALQFEGNLEGNAPYPVFEAAVRFKAPENADLSFLLDRGWVEVLNKKASGNANFQVQVLNNFWQIGLHGPGTRVGLLLYGRWPAGVAFSKVADAKHVPTLSLLITVLQGEASVETAGVEHTLTAPPGPARLVWDNIVGQDASATHLDKLPPWAVKSQDASAEAKEKKTALAQLTKELASRPVDEVLDDYIKSDEAVKRRIAVLLLAALDKLPRLGQAMRETKYADVRDLGVIALRHWIGRAPGQDQILYERLVEERKFTPVQTETILQLLHSFGESELARPETYQTLIDYLEHDSLPIRGLAYWHLHRLVPQGTVFGYDPAGSKEERRAAVEKWRKLIPEGKMPPPSKGPTADSGRSGNRGP